MSRKKTLWDHYLEAIQLLARAEVHLGFLIEDQATFGSESRPSLELSRTLQGEILQYIHKKAPSA